MMRQKSMLSALTALAILFGSYAAYADCPDGKVGVTLITPSGKEKQLCVSENALPGIENAGENAGATIVPSTCPCWTPDELNLVASRNPDTFQCYAPLPGKCVMGDFAADYVCGTKEDGGLFAVGFICGETKSPLACSNVFSLPPITESSLTQAQYDACLATMGAP